MNAIHERCINRADPQHERTAVVRCRDVGLDKGGRGTILLRVAVKPAPR